MACTDDESSTEIEITPKMVEAGLEWLYAYRPDSSLEHDKETIKQIIQSALANRPQSCRAA